MVVDVTQGDLSGEEPVFTRRRAEEPGGRTGVRALVVVRKPGNAGGAKERRKVEA